MAPLPRAPSQGLPTPQTKHSQFLHDLFSRPHYQAGQYPWETPTLVNVPWKMPPSFSAHITDQHQAPVGITSPLTNAVWGLHQSLGSVNTY